MSNMTVLCSLVQQHDQAEGRRCGLKVTATVCSSLCFGVYQCLDKLLQSYITMIKVQQHDQEAGRRCFSWRTTFNMNA
jgi:hypothetical protein